MAENMDYIHSILSKDHFAVSNGMTLTKVESGYAEARMEISEMHLNGCGLVQGGAIFTLADYAFAAASNAKGYVTVSSGANITFFRSPQGKYLIAKAEEVSSGRRLCTYNVDIYDESGTLVARYTGNGYIKNIKITDM